MNKVKKCRICYKKKFFEIVNFGKVYLSGNISKKKRKEKKYKLNLLLCTNCKHVQIGFIVNPDILFKNYFWETGVSNTNVSLINQLLLKLNKKKYLNQKKILKLPVMMDHYCVWQKKNTNVLFRELIPLKIY